MAETHIGKKQRNYQKQTVESLKNERFSELGKICGWVFVGIILCFTLIAPYLAYGYVRSAVQKRKEINEKIEGLTKEIR